MHRITSTCSLAPGFFVNANSSLIRAAWNIVPGGNYIIIEAASRWKMHKTVQRQGDRQSRRHWIIPTQCNKFKGKPSWIELSLCVSCCTMKFISNNWRDFIKKNGKSPASQKLHCSLEFSNFEEWFRWNNYLRAVVII